MYRPISRPPRCRGECHRRKGAFFGAENRNNGPPMNFLRGVRRALPMIQRSAIGRHGEDIGGARALVWLLGEDIHTVVMCAEFIIPLRDCKHCE